MRMQVWRSKIVGGLLTKTCLVMKYALIVIQHLLQNDRFTLSIQVGKDKGVIKNDKKTIY
jgi:hypothetical protein